MKIGLIRHFKVNQPFPKKMWLNKSEVIQWFEEYESAKMESKEVDLCGIDWKKCYSSSLNRAVNTARQIHDGEIIVAEELKELDILHLLPDRIKLPFTIWGLLVRIKSFASNKNTNEFRNNISTFTDELLLKNNSNILVVSHWFVMKLLQKELIKRGAKGELFKSPDYGKVYVFER